uniref:BTB domain-containing protein n=1 Tax=Electrophorus electricus TaxID=8005 RepID=A0A4W4G4B0_ELEEL
MIPNGYLIFEDESFLDSTVAKMNALRKSGQFCDVRLQVCGHELMAHRAVLACCSPYLFEIFNSDLEPHGVSHVKFEDLDPEAVEILLNYAYTAQLKADKEMVKEVYSAAKRLKMERVKQICGEFLLSKMDSQNAISYRNFASSMGDTRLLAKIDCYIQEHLLEVSEQENFLKLPRLKLEVMLEDHVSLPGNGKLYSKVISWVQRSLWENGEPLESLMEEVQTLYYSADHKLLDGGLLEGQAEVFGAEDDHIQFVQKKPPRENVHRQLSSSSSGSLSPGSVRQPCKHDWKYIASEKITNSTYLCLAVLNGVLCVIFLHGRSSPQASPSATPCLQKSLSFEASPQEEEPERLLAPMHYARSGLGTAALNGQLIAAGWCNFEAWICFAAVETWLKKSCVNVEPVRKGKQCCGVFGQFPISPIWPCSFLLKKYCPFEMAVLMVCVCSLNNKLYVVGGSDPCGQKGLKNCDAFDPVTKEWTSCAPLNIRRHQAAVCELDGFMYVIGGAESWNCLNSAERYNPENNTWTLIAPMNVARRGAGVGIYAGKLFVVGGFDGSHALRCVEVYDPARNEWRMLGSMTSARSNAGVAVLDDFVFAVGGFDGNEFLNTMEAYNPGRDEWSTGAEASTLA